MLAGTFGDLARLPDAPVAEVGIAAALDVLLDTLLARTVLVPAAFLSIGERVWWPVQCSRKARLSYRRELLRKLRSPHFWM